MLGFQDVGFRVRVSGLGFNLRLRVSGLRV